jgi:hypothetical protein
MEEVSTLELKEQIRLGIQRAAIDPETQARVDADILARTLRNVERSRRVAAAFDADGLLAAVKQSADWDGFSAEFRQIVVEALAA